MQPVEITPVYEKAQLYQINLSELQADPDQPRKVIDPQSLEDITASVAKLGVLQPILFRLDSEGNKIIVAGERRATAARAAGLVAIPAMYLPDANYLSLIHI